MRGKGKHEVNKSISCESSITSTGGGGGDQSRIMTLEETNYVYKNTIAVNLSKYILDYIISCFISTLIFIHDNIYMRSIKICDKR